MIVWTTLLKGFQIAFVCVFEIRKLISFALILKLVPGARKASSVQTSKCSREANCLARGLTGLADFGFVQEMFNYLSMRRLLLDKENTCMMEIHPSGREKTNKHKTVFPRQQQRFCYSISSKWITQNIGNQS